VEVSVRVPRGFTKPESRARGETGRTNIDPNCEDMFGQEPIAKISMNVNAFTFCLSFFCIPHMNIRIVSLEEQTTTPTTTTTIPTTTRTTENKTPMLEGSGQHIFNETCKKRKTAQQQGGARRLEATPPRGGRILHKAFK